MDKDSLRILMVPPPMIPVIWDQVEEHIDRMIAESFGDLDKDRLKDRLNSGNEMLLIVWDGTQVIASGIVTISTLDSGRKVLYVPGLGGSRMADWFDVGLETLRQLAKDFDCDGIRACGRAGWAKAIPTATPLHTIVEFN